MEFNKGGAGLNSAEEQKEKLRVALIIRDRLGTSAEVPEKRAAFGASFGGVSRKKKNHLSHCYYSFFESELQPFKRKGKPEFTFCEDKVLNSKVNLS